MHKRTLNACFAAFLISMTSNAASAQDKALATPTLDAMESAIAADPRVKELQSLPPEKLVSEATYRADWPIVHEREIYWKCRMFRTVDFRDKQNATLVTGFGNTRDVGALLIKGAMQGRYKVYSNADDRFTHEISVDSLSTLIKNSGISGSSKIQKFLVKQDWLYVGTMKMLVGRIIGIAPIQETVAADGVTTEKPLFWVYYPSTRPYLREQGLPSIDGSARNLDELFEGWKFNSPIISVRQSDQTKTLYFLPRDKKETILKTH